MNPLTNTLVCFHNRFISETLTTVAEQRVFVILLLLLLLWDYVSLSSQYIIIPSARRISLLHRASPPMCLSVDELTGETGQNKYC